MSKYASLLSFGPHLRNRLNRLTNISVNQRLKNVFDFYEDFIGVKEVRRTQEEVLKSESEFVESSKARRDIQNDMIEVQKILKQIRHKLDSTHRSDELYLSLITKEHQLIRDEIQMIDSLRRVEETERQLFSDFSRKLRDAHEVERLRQEKTKYLSVILSLIGGCIGIIGTSITYAMKRKDFKELAKKIDESNRLTHSLALKPPAPEVLEEEKQSLVKESIETQTDIRNDEKIVECISKTESNLEYKMKVNSLATVLTTYALIAITLPIVIRLLSD